MKALISTAVYSAEPARGWLPWGALAPFLAVLFVAAPLLGVSGILEYFRLVDANGDPIGLMGLYAFLLFPFAAIGLVVLAWVHLVERRSLASIGLAGADRTKTFLAGHLIGIATIFAVVTAIWIAGGYAAGGYGSAMGSPGSVLSIAFLLACFALQAGVEEIIFRGWLLSLIARKFDIVVAVSVTSAVFCFLHYSPQQHWLATLNLFLFSVFACAWALKADHIWGVMGWHAGWNWLLATGFELPLTGLDAEVPALLVELTADGPDYLTGGTQGPEGSMFCTLLFAGGIAFLLWRRTGGSRSHEESVCASS